ncbi:MAG: penicillin-binding protein 2 [Frankiales bacterium]|nr:penicillin-binding protein 2 [Frankiales bacterium]
MNERSRVRLFTLRVLVLSLLLALFGRLWFLQILSGDQYVRAATTTTAHDIITTATRGEILDDWGRPYAENKTALVVSANWQQLQQQPDRGYAVEQRLAALLQEDPRALVNAITPCQYSKQNHTASPPGCYSGLPYQPIPVTGSANTQQALQILERQDLYPGITATVQSIRQYESPLGSVGANLIGYLGKVDPATLKTGNYAADALVGASGIEAQYESSLRGTDGVKQVSLNRQGKQTAVISDTKTVPGDNVILSVDAGVQGLLENVLQQAVTQIAPNQPSVAGNPASGPHYPTTAAGIVMNAQTGEIVASASYPSYNPKVFEFPRTDADTAAIVALNKNPNHPLLNQVIQGQYAPGSTFKLVTTSAELDSGKANWTSLYNCPGSLAITKTSKPKLNSEGEQLGPINLRTTIAKSCDTVFYQFAINDYYPDYNRVVKLHQPAAETVTKMARLFGLNAQTGVDLPSESKGLIQSWDETAKLAKFYLLQYCIGAHGGKDSNGKKVAPNPDKAKRAADAAKCALGLNGTQILLPGNYADEYIGQGTVLATPLQMAVAYSALVNGGKVYSPKVAKAVVAPDGKLVKAIAPQVQRVLPVSQSDLANIQQAMYDVTLTGTAGAAFQNFPMNQVQVGGKTGTAQVANSAHPTVPDDTSVFASFAGKPGQKPQYVSIIIVPKAGYGASVAAPATRLLWDGMYGLEGKPNVMPQGLRTALPNFSLDGNMVTKAPTIAPAPRTPTPGTTGSLTAGTGTSTATPGTPAGTSTAGGAAPPAGKSAGATALAPLQSAPGASPPARVVAFGGGARSPPRAAAVR